MDYQIDAGDGTGGEGAFVISDGCFDDVEGAIAIVVGRHLVKLEIC